jgi:hypothetical protein
MTESMRALVKQAVFSSLCGYECTIGDEALPMVTQDVTDAVCAALSAPAGEWVMVPRDELQRWAETFAAYINEKKGAGGYVLARLSDIKTFAAASAAPSAQTAETKAGECSDCPPLEYPTDETRCAPCPNRAPASPAPTREGACCVDLGKEECGYPDCPGPKRTPLPDIAALRERAEKSIDKLNTRYTTFGFFWAKEASNVIRDLAAALPSTGTGEEGDKSALVDAVLEWAADRSPNDPGDARLMKAIWSYGGDNTEPCPECDGDCGEPCAPCTVQAAHAMLDDFIERWMKDRGVVQSRAALSSPAKGER